MPTSLYVQYMRSAWLPSPTPHYGISRWDRHSKPTASLPARTMTNRNTIKSTLRYVALSPHAFLAHSSQVSYDASLYDLHLSIQEQLAALLMDPSPVVKRAVLHNISALCIFLGRQKTNDVILSHMITYLNDRDWLLRHAFFESIVDVAACAGGRSLEEYILPLMIQALSGESAHPYHQVVTC
jgi:hypothetical protein